MGPATSGVMYLVIQFFIGAGHINHAVLAVTLPGLVAYAVASMAALSGAGGIAEEVNGGTLEAEGLIAAVVLAAAYWAGFGVHYTIRPDALVPLLLLLADALADALVMTALVLRVASIGAVVHVFNIAVMFLGGMFVPVSVFPHGVGIFARFLPTTLGTEVLNTALAGRGLGAAWSDGTLPWLLVHVAVLSGMGWAAYLATLRRARREGGLSPR